MQAQQLSLETVALLSGLLSRAEERGIGYRGRSGALRSAHEAMLGAKVPRGHWLWERLEDMSAANFAEVCP